MTLQKTVDDGRYLRIEDEADSAITIYRDRSCGHILSLIVQEENRKQGIARLLLAAAEQELFECGIQWIDADYLESLTSLTAFFEKTDFSVKPGVEVLSVPMRELLGSAAVKKVLEMKVPGTDFVPLFDLSFPQWDELEERFKKQHIRLESSDMARLKQDLSGVVYDDQKEPQAVVFCRELGDDLHVDFLLGFSKNAQKYIMDALRGMLVILKKWEDKNSYKHLTTISTNKNATALLEHALSGGQKPKKCGVILYAKKMIRPVDDDTDPLDDNEDAARRELWRKDIRKTPLQENVSYKLSWSRLRGNLEETAKEDGEKKSAPLEIRFDKNEDEKRGLHFSDTCRITKESLSSFTPFLPPDLARDLLRPFHRGLAVQKYSTEEPEAVMVWMYENMESDLDTKAKILYFHAKEPEAGKTLLSEYEEEIKIEAVTESSFFFLSLSDTDKRIFAEAGFDLEEKEGEERLFTMEDLASSPLLRNKTIHSTMSLSEITERQFKRGIARILFANREGVTEDLAYLSRSWFDCSVSACFIADGEVAGMLLFHRLASGEFYLDFAGSAGSDPEIEIIYLMRFSLMRMRETEAGDVQIRVRLSDENKQSFTERLFPGKSGEMGIFGRNRKG